MHSSKASLARAASACVMLVALACGGDTLPVAPADGPALQARVASTGGGPRRHVIVLKDGATTNLRGEIERRGGQVRGDHGNIGIFTTEDLSDAAVAALAARADVEAVVPDVRVQWIPPLRSQITQVRHLTTTGPRTAADQSGAAFFDFQWNMRVIRADQAWLLTQQGKGTLVCILDTGIDPTHIDLQGRVDANLSQSFVSAEQATEDLFGHGTFVAGIISSNGIGVASVAPNARLCSIKVLDKTGHGTFADMISGVVYGADIGADVLNMSLGAYFSRKDDGAKELIRALQRAMNYASRRGALLVAAAGNDGVNLNTDPRDSIALPAELDHVLSVGATGPVNQLNFDRIASYSNFGKSGVEVFAPGGDFVNGSVFQDLLFGPCSPSIQNPDLGTCGPLDYLIGDGTSFAAPHVSGEAAVIESQLSGNRRGGQLSRCVRFTADHPTGRRIDPLYGFGRIDVLTGARCTEGEGDDDGLTALR